MSKKELIIFVFVLNFISQISQITQTIQLWMHFGSNLIPSAF